MTDRTFDSSMPAEVTERQAVGLTFRDRVHAEARATWNGRWRWLWRGAAAVLVLLALSQRWDLVSTYDFYLFAILSAVVPAWLCADLLSIRTRDNPDPLREWSPAEFVVRAAGRLLPFLLAEAVWVGAFVGVSLKHDIGQNSGSAPILPELDIRRWSQFPNWWLAWTTVFLISGLTYAAWAGLLSASVRRPRRWAVLLLATLILTHVGIALLSTAMHEGDGFTANLAHGSWLQAAAVVPPNVWLGVLSARVLLDHWPALAPGRWDLSWLCWSASVMWLLYALIPALLTWWIAARRYRRHPYTAADELDRTEMRSPAVDYAGRGDRPWH